MATDYISREAAIKEFCDDCMDREWCKSNGDSCSRIKNINAVPAADVRPVTHGHWECVDDEDFSQPHVRCSNCGEYYFAWYRKFPYCPVCGADMRPEGRTEK